MKKILMTVSDDGEIRSQVELKDWYKRYGVMINFGERYKDLRLSGAEWVVFNCILLSIEYETNHSELSVAKISEMTNTPYRSAWRAISVLQKKHVIKKSGNVIVVNPRYAMRGKRISKKVLEVFNDEER